jgi:pimeloyl-ACP methyl ester carboxylesterase
MPRTIVLVHGAWHGAWCWAPLQAMLDAAGVPSLALDLPGHSTSREPLGDLYGDGAAVGRLLDTVAGDVVLVGHSYGGAVISEAAVARTKNVAHLVYVAAFCLEVDESVLGFSRGQPDQDYALATALVFAEDGTTVTVEPSRAREVFYGDCTDDQAATAIVRLGAQPLATFTQPQRSAPWKVLPSTYVLSERDNAVPASHQEVMAPRCGNLVRLDSDHSPFMSHTAQLGTLLASLAWA